MATREQKEKLYKTAINTINSVGVDVGTLRTRRGNTFVNMVIDTLYNKIITSKLLTTTLLKHNINKMFFEGGLSLHEREEVFTLDNLLDISDYNQMLKFEKTHDRVKTYTKQLTSIFKKKIFTNIPKVGFQAAFASADAFYKWASSLVLPMVNTLNLYTHEYIYGALIKGIRNVVYTGETPDIGDRITILMRLGEDMGHPSKKYSLGFVKPDKDTDTPVQSSSLSDLILGVPLGFKTLLETNVKPIKIHNAVFNTKYFKNVIEIPSLPKNEVLLFSKKGFRFKYNLKDTSQQDWAANLTTDMYSHIWASGGTLPWAIGVRIVFSDKPTTSITFKDAAEVKKHIITRYNVESRDRDSDGKKYSLDYFYCTKAGVKVDIKANEIVDNLSESSTFKLTISAIDTNLKLKVGDGSEIDSLDVNIPVRGINYIETGSIESIITDFKTNVGKQNKFPVDNT